MGEPLAGELEARLERLAAAAALLESPLPRERDEAVCHEAVRVIDALLVRVARGRGALDVAIGEGLDSLSAGDRVLQLGYCGIGDYARERLGIAASTALKMARLARELRDRPLLRAAVRAGEVSVRRAEAVLPVAKGDAEAGWVVRARRETVRALKVAVGEQCAGREPEEDERWTHLRAEVSPDTRPIVEEAMALAGKLLGATAPRWQRLEALCEEYLGSAGAVESCAAEAPLSNRELLEPAREWLEKESAQWAFLDEPGAVEAPSIDTRVDLRCLDAELQRLAELRERWDEVFGHVAMLFQAAGGWRRAGFASFEHYCTERLGMAERAIAQRIALERRLYELPALREAMREGRLAYEKARLIARHADEDSVGEWIARAEPMTCIEVRRALEAGEDAQMCARGELDVHMPRRLLALVAVAFRLGRRAAGRHLSSGECLRVIAQHFIDVWKPALVERSTVQKEVLARDRGLCRVPGCSRAAAHVHHVVYRSAGG
ncbi:MAG TPA: hypothetical protein VFP15_10985, partial [Gemmatimonadaceae bacterium]|nr:hypothetical protein [Gemmatimonadaceae bacterium]